MVSAVEAYEAAYKHRDQLKRQFGDKTRQMARVLEALETDPPTNFNRVSPDFSHALMGFPNGETFRSAEWLTLGELAKMMHDIALAEKAADDLYNGLAGAERRLIPRR